MKPAGNTFGAPNGVPQPSVLRQSGWSLDLPVEGHSMEPLLREGDAVTVVCESTAAWEPGDIICFRRENSFVLHRLIEQRSDGTWFEKGDAEAGGSWIDADAVVGLVTRVNGAPLNDRCRGHVLGFSRWEGRASHGLRRMRAPRFPARWHAVWRRLKTCLWDRITDG